MADIQVMEAQYPQTNRDPSIMCGVCDPMNIQNRLTYRRYDMGLLAGTVTPGASIVWAAQSMNLFIAGVGEAFAGAPAGAVKSTAQTNLQTGGAAADSPCYFLAYDLQVELIGFTYITAAANEQILSAMYYDQAYQREALHKLSTLLSIRIEEPSGCRDRVTVADMLPSDGSSRDTGDRNRSGLLGVSRGLRIAVCFPGQNAQRPFIVVELSDNYTLGENGANPFPATPAENNFGVLVRVTLTGATEGVV